MNTKRTARAVVYAARMARAIDQYGHTWANIEATTKAILEGHPVPPDNMVVVDTMGVTYTGPLVEPVSPGADTERVALELVDKYHAVRNEMRILERELSNTKEALRVESVAAQNARKELGEANARNTRQAETIRGIRGERDDAITRLGQLNQSNTELGAELVKARQEVDAMRGTQNGALACKVRQLESELNCAWAARDNWRTCAANTGTERDEANAKVVKLRTVLEDVRAYGDTLSTSSRIKEVLEVTK